MQVNKRSWTINLGGPNPGKDIGREISLANFKKSLDETADMFKAADNGEYRSPVRNIADHVLVGPDLDPQPGRVLADFTKGKFASKKEGQRTNPYYTNQSQLKCAFEFDPATGNALSYSGRAGVLSFDVVYEAGQIKEVKTESADGTYQELVKFSPDGKVVTFSSEQKLKEGEKAENRSWFLALQG